VHAILVGKRQASPYNFKKLQSLLKHLPDKLAVITPHYYPHILKLNNSTNSS